MQKSDISNYDTLQNDNFSIKHECIMGFNLIEERVGFVNAEKEMRLREILPIGVPCANGKILSYHAICYDCDSECWPLISQFLKVLNFEDILEKKGVIDFFLYRNEDKKLCFRVKLLDPDSDT